MGYALEITFILNQYLHSLPRPSTLTALTPFNTLPTYILILVYF